MGLIPKFISEAVSKVTNVVSNFGDFVKDVAIRCGLPKELAEVLSYALDPTKIAREAGAKLVDEVAKRLGVPEDVRKRLTNMVLHPEKAIQAFAEGGPGGLVRYMGEVLGLPEELTSAIALATNLVTQNYAGAAEEATKLAKKAAKHLGLPKELQDAISIADGVLSKDPDAIRDGAVDLAVTASERLDMPDVVKAGVKTAAKVAKGDTDALRQDGVDYLKSKVDDFVPDFLQPVVNEAVDELAEEYVLSEEMLQKRRQAAQGQVRG